MIGLFLIGTHYAVIFDIRTTGMQQSMPIIYKIIICCYMHLTNAQIILNDF